MLAVDFVARNQDTFRHERGVERVPVHVVGVPVSLVAAAEENGECLDELLLGDDKEAVAVFDARFGVGENDLALPPKARYDKFGVVHAAAAKVVERLMEHGGVAHGEGGDEGLVVALCVAD